MAIPFLSNIDLNKNQLLNHTLHNATSNPSTTTAGQIYFNTTSNKVLVFDPSAGGGSGDWVSIAGDIESVSAGTYLNGGGTTGALTINHDDTTRTDTTSTDDPAYGGTFEAVTSVTTNAQGHVTAIDVSTVTIPASDNTDTKQSIAAASDDDDKFITFVETATGDQTGMSGANFKFNPGTDTLKVTNLVVSGTQTVQNETIQVVENNTIAFEGTTEDDFEIKLTAEDATISDKVITLPNATGTVALTSDINDATLTVEGDNGLTGSGTFTANDADTTTITLSHADTSSQASVNNSGRTYIQDITLDTYGHITGITSATETVTDTNTQLATAAALIDVSAMASNSTASFTHGLASQNLIVQMYDTNDGQVVHADIDHTSTSAISILFSKNGTQMVADGIGDIRVVVIDAKNGLTDKTVTYS
jgi:hypothetical protein